MQLLLLVLLSLNFHVGYNLGSYTIPPLAHVVGIYRKLNTSFPLSMVDVEARAGRLES